jgi:hypothetical protein
MPITFSDNNPANGARVTVTATAPSDHNFTNVELTVTGAISGGGRGSTQASFWDNIDNNNTFTTIHAYAVYTNSDTDPPSELSERGSVPVQIP